MQVGHEREHREAGTGDEADAATTQIVAADVSPVTRPSA